MASEDSTLRAFVRGLADSADDRNGLTYDDDPASERSVAYDLGRTYGERATFSLAPLVEAVSCAEDGTANQAPYTQLALEAETTATALRALCDDTRTRELLDDAVLAVRARRRLAVNAAAAT
jgi:hypothetical protein